MEKILLNFLLDLNDKGLINNHDFDYEIVARKFANKDENKQLILSGVSNQRELLTQFAVFMVNNIESGKTPASLVNDFYETLGQ